MPKSMSSPFSVGLPGGISNTGSRKKKSRGKRRSLSDRAAEIGGITIAAQFYRPRLDNFAHAERIEHAANAHEAVRTLLRSWHTPGLPQRQAPREQCSASAKEFARGVSQRSRRLCALRWVAPRLLRRGISTALRVGAVAARRKSLISSMANL